MGPFEEPLPGGLVVRTVRSQEDVERYDAFHRAFVSVTEGITCARLMRHHPEAGFDEFLIVQDRASGEMLSTTCLIPWRCRYEGIELRVAMLEMVLTHPEHRHRGLVRQQMGVFERMVESGGYDLSVIEGIPYYYRQFGYAHAIDHRSFDVLAASQWRAPATVPTPGAFSVRSAKGADAPVLNTLYRQAMQPLALHTERSEAHWRYLLDQAELPVRMVHAEPAGEPAGYFVPFPRGQGQGVYVYESVLLCHGAAMAVLAAARKEWGGDIHVGWPEQGLLVQAARSLGSSRHPSYQWLVRITDVPGFLMKLAPALESRVRAGGCARLTADLVLNLYRQAYVMRWRSGSLTEVAPAGFMDSSMGADCGDLCIPPDAFVRLALGYRSLDELADAWPDIVVRPSSRRWLEVLFPKMTSYLCMAYMYAGPT